MHFKITWKMDGQKMVVEHCTKNVQVTKGIRNKVNDKYHLIPLQFFCRYLQEGARDMHNGLCHSVISKYACFHAERQGVVYDMLFEIVC